MQIGMIGLGRMGMNMVQRLLNHGHDCVAFDVNETSVKKAADKGAIGAGAYPPLAGNENLAAAGYPVAVVVNGRHGMPPVGAMMSDDQVAAVVNYVRTHFGNTYKDAVDAADVKVVRP